LKLYEMYKEKGKYEKRKPHGAKFAGTAMTRGRGCGNMLEIGRITPVD